MRQLAPSKYLTQAEQTALNDNLKKVDCKRDQAMIRTLLATGARATEVLNITRGDLIGDTEACEYGVYIKGLKGSEDRVIPVEKALYNELVKLAEADPKGRPFPIKYSRLQHIWYAIRPVPKKLHSTRHTFAINLYAKTKDLLLVQAALGHRDISNTMVYSKHVTVTQSLRKALV